MFIFRELSYQLRRKKQTMILISAAALLIGCMTFYLGNIQSTRAALDGLAESTPVTVTVTSRDGGRTGGLCIDTERFEALTAAGVHNVRCHSSFVGAYGEIARAEDPFNGGDTSIVGANSVEAAGLDPKNVRFQDGWDSSFFSGTGNYALVGESYAEKFSLKPGDAVTLPVYLVEWGAGNNLNYAPVGEMSLEIIGVCSPEGAADNSTAFYMPVRAMREETERAGVDFCYQSLSCVLDDPMDLNEFKHSLPAMGFLEPDPEGAVTYSGDTVVIDDEMFIKTAGRLRQNLSLFQSMLLPFLCLILLLSLLTVFLTFRGSRREMAVSLSLGQSKGAILGKYLLFVLAVDLIAGIVMFPVICLGAGLSPIAALAVCGIFSAAMLLGGSLALFLLLGFEPMELLTKEES